MVWKEFDFTSQWTAAGTAYRPLLQVTFSNAKNSFSPLSLLDTGTDMTLVTYEIANELGINLNPCRNVKVSGVGDVTGKICDIELEVIEFNLKKSITAIFVPNLPFSALSGQRDFFNELDVRFEVSKKKFYLRQSKP